MWRQIFMLLVCMCGGCVHTHQPWQSVTGALKDGGGRDALGLYQYTLKYTAWMPRKDGRMPDTKSDMTHYGLADVKPPLGDVKVLYLKSDPEVFVFEDWKPLSRQLCS